jgi:sugar/nucleoside kinase (ribokinase family)
VSVDVAVIGSPFLDLVFAGMPRLPGLGEEVVGRTLHVVPGGTAIQAIGLARLGVPVALVSPRGSDVGGRLLAETLARERVDWLGPSADRTPATAVLSTPDGVGMASVTDQVEVTEDDVISAGATRVVVSLGRAHLRPPGVPACFVSGSIEIEAGVRPPDDEPVPGDLLIVNEREARSLTGEDVEGAARTLASGGMTAVVTSGKEPAIGVRDGELARATPPRVDLIDATGAGDLFVAALVWADRQGSPLAVALAWACLYAALSVGSPTALEGARHLDQLLEEGRRQGLSPP